jgi:hypothetical protein
MGAEIVTHLGIPSSKFAKLDCYCNDPGTGRGASIFGPQNHCCRAAALPGLEGGRRYGCPQSGQFHQLLARHRQAQASGVEIISASEVS